MLPEWISMKFFGENLDETTGKSIPIAIERIRVFYAVLIGLAVGGLIAMLTEYYTAMGKKPVMGIIKNSSTGAATNTTSTATAATTLILIPLLRGRPRGSKIDQ